MVLPRYAVFEGIRSRKLIRMDIPAVLGLYRYDAKVKLLTVVMVLVDAVVLCLGGIKLFRASELFDMSCATKFDIYMVSLP